MRGLSTGGTALLPPQFVTGKTHENVPLCPEARPLYRCILRQIGGAGDEEKGYADQAFCHGVTGGGPGRAAESGGQGAVYADDLSAGQLALYRSGAGQDGRVRPGQTAPDAGGAERLFCPNGAEVEMCPHFRLNFSGNRGKITKLQRKTWKEDVYVHHC